MCHSIKGDDNSDQLSFYYLIQEQFFHPNGQQAILFPVTYIFVVFSFALSSQNLFFTRLIVVLFVASSDASPSRASAVEIDMCTALRSLILHLSNAEASLRVNTTDNPLFLKFDNSDKLGWITISISSNIPASFEPLVLADSSCSVRTVCVFVCVF